MLPSVMELAKHPKELVRKKAVMAVHRFEQLDPEHDGPLHNVDTYALIRETLRDKVGAARVYQSRSLKSVLGPGTPIRPTHQTVCGLQPSM